MSVNTIEGYGAVRFYPPIPKDSNGTPFAAIFDNPLIQERLRYVLTLVHISDVGADYVSGSAGQYKTIKAYSTTAVSGDAATTYTFKYQDAAFPTKVTDITISDSTV